MRRMRQSAEVRSRAVRLYLTTEMSAKEVADDIGVHERTIFRWVEEDGRQTTEVHTGKDLVRT